MNHLHCANFELNGYGVFTRVIDKLGFNNKTILTNMAELVSTRFKCRKFDTISGRRKPPVFD